MRTVSQDIGKSLRIGIAINAGHRAGQLLSEQGRAVAFQLLGGEAIRRRPPILDGLGVGHIIAEPLPAAGGMGRSHRPAMAIDDQPLQQAGQDQSGLSHCFGAQRGQDRLCLIEQLTLDDRLVLALVDLFLVRDLADVGTIAQQAA